MTTLEILGQIPAMLYVSLLFLPAAFFAFLSQSAPKQAIPAKIASPADQLKTKRIDTKRESLSAVFLGACIAFGAAIVIFIGGLVADYKDSRGIFAQTLAARAFPPAPSYVLPPAPVLDESGAVAGENKSLKSKNNSGGLLK